MNLSYPTYDANGNITAINNTLDATKNKAFTYDALDRLSTATASGIWGSLAWTYDGVGNRQTEGSNVYSYVPNTNKLSGAGGTSFGYDNNGNTTSQAARQYTYNQNQRLIQVVDGAMTAGYTYNGNGQRVKKTVNGVTTIFHYNRDGQIIAESDSTGATTAEYVYLNSQPLAKIEGSSVYFYHNDHLATPQKMTDSSGSIVWAADYKPFGEATVTVSTITNNLRFPGQYFDAETGLNYNYFRDYNPVIGRYVESDPLGTRNGRNHLYVYVSDNPAMGIDPRGLIYFIPGYQNVIKGPATCGRCEQRVEILELWGYTELVDPTAAATEGMWFYFTTPQLYYHEDNYACVHKCCKANTYAVEQHGTGPVTPQNWFINNVFTFTWTAQFTTFDCSDCQNRCKNKCK